MLSVPIHKDFTEYKPKVLGSLSGRTLICIAVIIAIAIAIGALCTVVLNIDSVYATPIIWAAIMPPAAVGFWSPHGMKFEEFFPLWYDHTTRSQLLLYKSPSYRGEAAQMRQAERKKSEARRSRDGNPYYAKLRNELGFEAWNCGELPGIGTTNGS